MTIREQDLLDMETERRAVERTRAAMDLLVETLADYPMQWAWGDGYGGAVMEDLNKRLLAAGFDRKRPKNRSPTSRAPSIPWGRRYEVMERDGFRCLKCGAQKRLTMDHIRPISQLGDDSIENLQTLCLSCNVSKGVRTMDYR